MIIPDITKTPSDSCLLSNRIGEQARWSEPCDLAHSGFSALVPQEKVLPLLNKLVYSWLRDIGLVLFCALTELGQYATILNSCLVNKAFDIHTYFVNVSGGVMNISSSSSLTWSSVPDSSTPKPLTSERALALYPRPSTGVSCNR